MAADVSSERRRFFRLPYPEGPVRPMFLTVGGGFPVTEISEKGLRFACQRFAAFKLNQPVKGIVRFQNGQTCSVEGAVLRLTSDTVVLFLSRGIPLNQIIAEQRVLINLRRSSPSLP
ncbi:MAG: hypothetical protein ACYC7E_14900 [Armatimonadota bacterium]